MADWVVDNGLDKLLAQINAAAPNRSKDSDGSIGDAAHQARASDHNPESPPPAGNPDNEVDARDFTHDPDHGADMHVVSESIRLSKDRRVSYVIFWHRIFYSYIHNGLPPFTWQTYTGSTDPHENHMHVSVNDVHHDETQAWEIGIDDMDAYTTNAIKYLDNRVAAFIQGKDDVAGTPSATQAAGEDVWPVRALKALQADVAALKDGQEKILAALAGGSVPGGGATPAEVTAIVDARLDAHEATEADALRAQADKLDQPSA